MINRLKDRFRHTTPYRLAFRSYYGQKELRSYLGAQWRRVVRSRAVVRRYFSAQPSPCLHIGSGSHLLSGWLNTDLRPATKGVGYLDATKRFPFADDTFAHVFSEHTIEHLSLDGGRTLLREALRVLRPGGRIRVSTPDLSFLTHLLEGPLEPVEQEYVSWSLERYWGKDSGTPAMVVNNFFYSWGHRFVYDEATLRRSLEEVGFRDIQRYAVGLSEVAALRNLENEGRFPEGFVELESLVLEAVKPDQE